MINKNTHTNEQQLKKGTLFVVATPIGNLADISKRALEILNSVDVIACEDTRHTRKLCSAFDIRTPLTSYYREKEQQKSKQLVSMLCSGKSIALVSDAGTPAISDPGAILVQKARKEEIEIFAIAGPCALTTALSISGLEESNFFFGGFLPAKSSERKKRLNDFRSLPCPLVFYESPHRIKQTLQDMINVLGDRKAKIFRELTKIHEECMDGLISELLASLQKKIKGELVIIVNGSIESTIPKPDNIEELISWYKNEHNETLKDTVRLISTDLDIPRSSVYKLALQVWKNDPDE